MDQSQVDLAKTLRAQGLSYEKIAAQCGVSDSTIYKYLRPRPPKPPSPPKPETKKVGRPTFSKPLHHFQMHHLRPSQMKWSTPERPSPTKSELYRQLAAAVRNTV